MHTFLLATLSILDVIIYVFAGVFFFALIIIYFILKHYIKQNKHLKANYVPIETITKDINDGYIQLVNNSDVGMITIDKANNIAFRSQTFKDKFADYFDSEVDDINDIDTNLPNLIRLSSENFIKTLKLEDKYFEYHFNFTKNNNLIYFYDVTERETAKQELRDFTMAIGRVAVRLSKAASINTLNENKIRSIIFSKIEKYFDDYRCQVYRLDDEHLTFICTYKDFTKLCEDKFSIVDDIRNIEQTDEIKVLDLNGSFTPNVCIGVATKMKTIASDIGVEAARVLQLAINRGGNQVWISEEGKTSAFGKRDTEQKIDKLDDMDSITAQVINKCSPHKNLFITTHKLADADAVGSMIAAYILFRQSTNCNIKIIVDENELEDTAHKLFIYLLEENKNCITLKYNATNYEDIFITREKSKDFPLADSILCICDTQSPDLLMYPNIEQEFKEYFVIDHHVQSNRSFPQDIDIFNKHTSSTVEIILQMYQFAPKMNLNEDQVSEPEYPLTNIEADVMLTGILVDTANFTYRTTNLTFNAVSVLSRHGADMVNAKKFTRDNVTYEMMISKAISEADLHLRGFAVSYIETVDKTLLAKIADRLLTLDGINASISIGHYFDDVDHFMISARSYGNVNVENILKEVGGGGHHNAAGCAIPNAKIASITKEELLDIINIELENECEDVEKMEVYLMQDIEGFGKRYEKKKCANGYANNLIRQGKAKRATPEIEKEIIEMQAKNKAEELRKKEANRKLKEIYDGKSIQMTMKIGKDGRSIGSDITADKISKELEKLGYGIIDKKNISIDGNKIKSLGDYNITINISPEEKAHMTINVVEG